MAVLSTASAVALIGNDYRIYERQVRIQTSTGSLDATLAEPEAEGAKGLVVMIHGDGPVDSTQNGLYRPWFEAAADAGFATLSWSKPGIGSSTGNWLDQSMSDRADEASAAIDWALSQPDVPHDKLVLWGASQAGWVLPKVVAGRTDIDAIVAVAPAVNWLRQAWFNTLAELDAHGADSADRDHALAASDLTRRLLDDGADCATYSEAVPNGMDCDRWRFVQRNYLSDATSDLEASSGRAPVYLMLGEHDTNVDVHETEETYARIFGSDLTVRYFDSVHSMARPVVEDSEIVGVATGLIWPRALLADGVLDGYSDFLSGL